MFMTAHVEVNSSVPILKSHDVVDNIEKDFLEHKGIDLTIHMDPIDVDDPYTQNLRIVIRNKIKEYSKDLDLHDFRIVKGDTHTNILFDVEMPINYPKDKYDVKKDIEEIVKSVDSKFCPVLGIDQMYDRK